MVLALVLLHCQLQLTNGILDLDLEDDVLGLLLLQPVVHLDDRVSMGRAGLV